MNQKTLKKLRKFCLLFKLDFDYAKDLFEKMPSNIRHQEMKDIRFALLMRSKELTEMKKKRKLIEKVKYTVSKNLSK